MSPKPSPIQILIDLPAEQWDGLARAVRRAVDQLPLAQVPVALRPFSRWQPQALRDTARARAAMAQALVDDARFCAEVAQRVVSAARHDATDTADPLTLRSEVGVSQAIALLAASARWADLATLAADVASEQAASGTTAAEGDTAGGAARTGQVRALRRLIAELERRDAKLRRTVRRLTSERDDAVAEADRARDQHAALQQTRDRELAAQRARLARLRRRVALAEQRAAASDARRDEIVAALAELTGRLQAPTGAGLTKGDEHPPIGTAASPTPAVSVPSRVAPATAGRPSRLPPGIDPDSPAAVTSLLQSLACGC